MVTETDINEDLRTLAQDAENARLYNSPPDAIVLRAIDLGMGTRAEIRRATGFGPDVVEKCLERNSGDLRSDLIGEIEHFRSANAPRIEKGICVDCGGPRSDRSWERCKKCYDAQEAQKKIDAMIARGKEPPTTTSNGDGVTKEKQVGYVEFDGEASPKSEKNITETITAPLCACGLPMGHRGRHRGTNGQKADKPGTKVRTEIAQPKPVKVVEPDKKQDKMLDVKMTPQQFIERFNSFDDVEIEEFFTKMNEQSTDCGVVWGVLPEEPKHSKQFFSVAYNVLVTMLDDGMSTDQKQSVWALICYLKRQQKNECS